MTLCNLQIHWLYIFFSFSSLAQQLAFSLTVKTRQTNAPKGPAKKMRQNDPPKYLAVKICRIHPREWPAEFTCQKNLPFQLAACLPENPPSLLKIPRQDLARHPPPPTAPPTEPGGGGREPARPTHAYWTGTFHFFPHLMNGYIFLCNTTYAHSTQSRLTEISCCRRRNNC